MEERLKGSIPSTPGGGPVAFFLSFLLCFKLSFIYQMFFIFPALFLNRWELRAAGVSPGVPEVTGGDFLSQAQVDPEAGLPADVQAGAT